jgi:hypothetical protein
MIKVMVAVTCILFPAVLSFSQQQNWQFVLADRDTLANVVIREIKGDSVAIAFADAKDADWIPVDSVVEVRKINKPRFWRGAGIGLLAGTVAGAMIGRASYQEPKPSPNEWNFDFGPGLNTFGGGIVGGAAGFLAGGLIGVAAGRDEVYKLSEMTHSYKINTLRVLLAR